MLIATRTIRENILLGTSVALTDSEIEAIAKQAQIYDLIQSLPDRWANSVIVQRLSIVQHADCIYVLDSGKVGELGIHSEQLSKRGVYFHIVRKFAAA
jgi:ABC-type multidrug transport system fused ATPase/permease subunit